MKKLPRGRLTYANVISTLALFLVLTGGAAYAASHLASDSVGTKQLKKGAVTPAKLSAASKDAMVGPRGLTGVQGPPGAPGAPGAPGSAKAWARISYTAKVLDSSGNIAATRLSTGRYCIDADPYTTANSVAVASPDSSDAKANAEYRVIVANGTQNNECPAGQFEVTGVRDPNILEDLGFTFIIG